MYRDILDNNLFQSVKKLKLGKDWIFQHDNDPKHRAGVVTNWLDQKQVERLKWPSYSPDINPIEHLWDEVERRMKKVHPKNEKELKEALLRVWNNIEVPVLKKLVDSVPNQLHEVIKMKGYPTRY
ncbi:unnamed protein product [Rotaria magnacalcarata]|nr:unnamed protein product [Rotaria magnacalcarata]